MYESCFIALFSAVLRFALLLSVHVFERRPVDVLVIFGWSIGWWMLFFDIVR